MFKKSDWLPLILAFVSTVLVVSLGYWWIHKTDIVQLATENILERNNTSQSLNSKGLNSQSAEPTLDSPDTVFIMPTIVPEGTSVIINGSAGMNSLNEAFKRNFQRQFPRTAITTYADGSKIAMELLATGSIDLVALERPLHQTEEASLAAVKVNNFTLSNARGTDRELYYVYCKPINPDVEIFLGYVLSPVGRQITLDALTVNRKQ